jgi:GH43 family beta-xylosidase
MPELVKNAAIHAAALLRAVLPALAFAFALAGCTAPARTGPPASAARGVACTLTNPIGPGADPWIVRRGATYYTVQSRNDAIYVYRSDALTQPMRNGVKVWSAPDTGWNRKNVWAPELHFVDGRWYVYYAAGRAGPPFLHQRAGVLESATDDPQGRYVDRGMLYTGDSIATGTHPFWAIDLTVHRINGQLYAYWSGWQRDSTTDRTPQHLYVARMSNPYTIATNRVLVSSPVEPWERGTELDLQEGPEVLTHAGQTFVIYSTRESWLREYKLGQLRLRDANADPLRPESYAKSGPVFTGAGTVYGVGHASFTTSPDSTEDWIAYHTKVSTAPGWQRAIHLQRFGWKPDGSPDFGTPVQPGQPIAVPSGECR